MKFYTGIGSRNTPKPILDKMVRMGRWLDKNGYTLRSGGAVGADSAFEQGVKDKNNCHIYTINGIETNHAVQTIHTQELENWDEAYAIAQSIHPAWDKCDDKWAKPLHTRNVYQILGHFLDTPSDFVLYWAERDNKGQIKGGTRTAIVLAEQWNIPCINMLDKDWKQQFKDMWA